MKKLLPFFLAILFILPSSASAYIVYFGFDATMPFENITGFEAIAVGQDVTDAANSFETYVTSEAVLGGFGSFDGLAAAPPGIPSDILFNWSVLPAGSSIGAFETSFTAPLPNPLNAGTAWSFETPTTDAFSLASISLTDLAGDPINPLSYNVLITDLGAEVGKVYTLSQVPIPGAFLLLGSGLIGLVGLRRKLS